MCSGTARYSSLNMLEWPRASQQSGPAFLRLLSYGRGILEIKRALQNCLINKYIAVTLKGRAPVMRSPWIIGITWPPPGRIVYMCNICARRGLQRREKQGQPAGTRKPPQSSRRSQMPQGSGLSSAMLST